MESEGVRFVERPVVVEPVWKKIIVESNLPESLSPLRELSKNLWWVWNTEIRELFQYIDCVVVFYHSNKIVCYNAFYDLP